MNKLTPENEAILKRSTATFIHNGNDPTIKLTIILAPEEFALAIQNATAQKAIGIAENWPGGSLIRNKLREAFGLAPENEGG